MKNIALLIAAASLCAPACQKPPTEAEIHLAKGNELFAKSDFAGAGAALEQSLKLQPQQDVKVWEKAAFSYMKAGNTDKAAELLVKASENGPKEKKLEALRNVAGMYLQAQQGDKAEQYFLEVMKLDPKDDQSLSWLAEIASIRGGARDMKAQALTPALEVAMGRYDQVIALTPKAPGPYVNKRIALIKYINHLIQQRDAMKNKKEVQILQAKIDQLKATLDETTRQLSEISKAAKAAKAAAK